MLEHLGFLAELHLERRRVCEPIFTVEKWQFVSGAPPLPLRDPAEDQPAPEAPTEEPHILASIVPIATGQLPVSSEPPVPPVLVDSTRPSTFATPMEIIPISPRDFLAIMTLVCTLIAISASFAIAYAALAEQMARTEAILG